jgi:hypothetical protein
MILPYISPSAPFPFLPWGWVGVPPPAAFSVYSTPNWGAFYNIEAADNARPLQLSDGEKETRLGTDGNRVADGQERPRSIYLSELEAVRYGHRSMRMLARDGT